MALISNKKEEVTAEASDLLLDTGWVNLQGEGQEEELSTHTFDVDTTVYMFIKAWRATSSGAFNGITFEWDPHVSGTFQNIATWWMDTGLPNDNFKSEGNGITDGRMYMAVENSASVSSSNPRPRDMRKGFESTAGQTIKLTRRSGLSASQGLCYRLVIKKSTADGLFEWGF